MSRQQLALLCYHDYKIMLAVGMISKTPNQSLPFISVFFKYGCSNHERFARKIK